LLAETTAEAAWAADDAAAAAEVAARAAKAPGAVGALEDAVGDAGGAVTQPLTSSAAAQATALRAPRRRDKRGTGAWNGTNRRVMMDGCLWQSVWMDRPSVNGRVVSVDGCRVRVSMTFGNGRRRRI
jgi:hypothetical protein